MKRLLITIVLAVAAGALATTAQAATKPQAYKIHRACLLKEAHASFVGHRPDGGGFATWHSSRWGTGSAFWTYNTTLGQVASVTVRFAGQPGLPQRTKRLVNRCLQRGI